MDEIYNGQSAKFPIYYRTLSPVDASYIEYSTYIYATEFDKVILRQALASSKPQRNQILRVFSAIDQSTDSLDQAMQRGDMLEARVQVKAMKAVVQVTRRGLDSLIVPGKGDANSPQQKLLAGRLFNAVPPAA